MAVQQISARGRGEKNDFGRAMAAVRSVPNTVRTVAVIAFFIFWHISARDANQLFLVGPIDVFWAGVDIFNTGAMGNAFAESMEHFLIGLGISIFGGIAIGVMIGQWWFFEYTMDPFINGFYVMPRIAFIPLFIMWFGLETTVKVVILVSIAIFPVIINTYTGIKDTRGAMLDIGRVFGASESQIFFKITLPGAVPYVMAGVRLCVGLAIIGMVVAEFFTATTGFGGMIRDSGDAFYMAELYIAIVIIGFIGIVLTEVTGWIERRLSHWRTLERERAR